MIDPSKCRVEIDSEGFRWLVCDEDSALPLRESEFIVRDVLRELVQGVDTFVDVGAHVGRHAIRLARLCKRVIAVEPNPINVEILRKNIELNNLSNVATLQVAASNRRTRLVLRLDGAHSSILDTVVVTSSSTTSGIVEVEASPLDDLVDRADVVKIDVEGHEVEVVQGMRRIIRDCRPILVIEHHEYYVPNFARLTVNEIGRILSDYVGWRIGEAHWIWIPKEVDIVANRKRFRTAIYAFWCFHVLNNVRMNRPWYLGIPETWWWGMSAIEFIVKLREHVEREESWFVEATRMLGLGS